LLSTVCLSRCRTRRGITAKVSSALAIYLTVWFGLFPLLQVAHLAFADHDHLYCSERGQIEDVPRAAARDLGPASAFDAARASTALRSDRAEQYGAAGHAACALLNHKTARDPLALTAQPELISHPDPPCPPTEAHAVAVTQLCLLSAAPKTSPPPRAA